LVRVISRSGIELSMTRFEGCDGDGVESEMPSQPVNETRNASTPSRIEAEVGMVHPLSF
jgi:hypothetical protein